MTYPIVYSELDKLEKIVYHSVLVTMAMLCHFGRQKVFTCCSCHDNKYQAEVGGRI